MSDDRERDNRERDGRDRREPLNPGDEAAPGTPGSGEDVCSACEGTGRVGERPCSSCGGTGIVQEGIGGG